MVNAVEGPVQLVLCSKNIDKVPLDELSLATPLPERTIHTGRNRSSVRLAMEGIGAQVKAAFTRLRAEHSDSSDFAWIKKMFQEVDEDGNGLVDQHEFGKVLQEKMNVSISKSDLELIWPLFDKDNSGGLDYKEFFAVVNPDEKNPQYLRTDFVETMQKISKQQRAKRISDSSLSRRTKFGSVDLGTKKMGTPPVHPGSPSSKANMVAYKSEDDTALEVRPPAPASSKSPSPNIKTRGLRSRS